jgi:uncharacterized protein
MSASVTKLLLGAALAAFCLGPLGSRAAELDCTGRLTATEIALCGKPGLARLDRDVAAAYADILKDFQLASEARKVPAVTALESMHRAFLAERDHCAGDTACLDRIYRRRLAVLGSRPDPDAASPVDGFIGAFAVEHTPSNADFALTLFKGEGDTALVEIAATGPSIACSIVGIGRLDDTGKMAVQIAPGKATRSKPGTATTLLLAPSVSGLTVEPGTVAAAACGQHADLAQDYARLDPQAVAAAAAIATKRPAAATEPLSLTSTPSP